MEENKIAQFKIAQVARKPSRIENLHICMFLKLIEGTPCNIVEYLLKCCSVQLWLECKVLKKTWAKILDFY
jgi:hypothetical protein